MTTNHISRRGFVASSSARLALGRCSTAPKQVEREAPKASVPDSLGAQLYTVRKLMPEDMAGTLKRIADLG